MYYNVLKILARHIICTIERDDAPYLPIDRKSLCLSSFILKHAHIRECKRLVQPTIIIFKNLFTKIF